MSPPAAVAVADADRHAIDRAIDLNLDLAQWPDRPAEPGWLDHLRAAVAGLTGLDPANPRTADLMRTMVAALMAALLSERPADRDTAAPCPPDPAVAYLAQTAPSPGETPAHRNERPNKPHLTLARPELPVEGQVCTVFAVDIAGFTQSDRDDDIRRYLHHQLYDYLSAAFDAAGVPWGECFREDRGDGVLVVIPPEISVKGLIDPLPEKLRGLLRRHNHVSTPAAQMQLRAAVTIGPLEHDGHGFVGTDVNLAFRMLASRPLKRMLAASGAELGLVVSEYVYRGFVCRYPSLVRPGAFQPVRFQSKNTRARAWTYLPGTATPASPVTPASPARRPDRARSGLLPAAS